MRRPSRWCGCIHPPTRAVRGSVGGRRVRRRRARLSASLCAIRASRRSFASRWRRRSLVGLDQRAAGPGAAGRPRRARRTRSTRWRAWTRRPEIGFSASTRTPHSSEVVPTSFTEARSVSDVADVHRFQEGQLVDAHGDAEPAGVPDRGERRGGVGQAHDHPAVDVARDVRVGDLHQLGQRHVRVRGAAGRVIGRVVQATHPTCPLPERRDGRLPSGRDRPGRRRLPRMLCRAGRMRACSVVRPRRPSTSTATSSTASPTSTPASATSSPAPDLPAGIPNSFDRDLPSGDVPADELVPPSTDVTGTWYATTSAGDAIVVSWACPAQTPRTPSSHAGVAVWRRFDDGGAPWRPGYGVAYSKGAGVYGIGAVTGDMTGDGSDDALVFAETGGTGGCGTCDVVDLAAGSTRSSTGGCATRRSPRRPTHRASRSSRRSISPATRTAVRAPPGRPC